MATGASPSDGKRELSTFASEAWQTNGGYPIAVVLTLSASAPKCKTEKGMPPAWN